MGVIAELARPGDWFAAEFRTDEDADEQKVHQKHYRRFQNGPAFGRKVEQRYGFTVVDVQEGQGVVAVQGGGSPPLPHRGSQTLSGSDASRFSPAGARRWSAPRPAGSPGSQPRCRRVPSFPGRPPPDGASP